MEKEVSISIYLDKRRAKSDGTYPIKLRVFTSLPRKQMLYNTAFSVSEKEFESTWLTVKPKAEFRPLRDKLIDLEKTALGYAEGIKPFSFDQFEKKLLRNKGDGNNVFWHYQIMVKAFNENNQLGNASVYNLSLKSIKDYMFYVKGKIPDRLLFTELTVLWLKKYESYMLNTVSKSRTTVSIYTRTLRSVFNHAIREKEADKDSYPFGKGKYEIMAVQNTKKALSRDQLKSLFEAINLTPEQEKARDFWFFSYICNGINVKDILMLRYEDMKDDRLTFYRAKTINTARSHLKPVDIYLTDFAKRIIEKYGDKNRSPKTLIFPIINDLMPEVEKRTRIKNFTKFINQNLKKLAEKEGVTTDISTYWARHSFATQAVRNGASMAFVSEALSHSNVKTTAGYFAGFEDSTKKELTDKLMDF